MRSARPWFVLGSVLLLLALGLAVVGVAGAAPLEQQVQIAMTGPPPHFEPANVTVPVGTTVTWVVTAGNHSSTSRDGLWDSGVGGVGTSVSYTFNEPGTFRYFCIPHEQVGMVGTVTVVAAGAAAPAAAPAAAQMPSALPRTGDLPFIAGGLLAGLGGLASLGVGVLIRRRSS